MLTPQILLERAKQGEPSAIAFLFSLTLNKQHQSVSVLRQGGNFEFRVAASVGPPRLATTHWIIGALFSLAISGLETATIYGKMLHGETLTWQQTVRFSHDSSLVNYLFHQSDIKSAGYVAPALLVIPTTSRNNHRAFSVYLDLSKYCFIRNRFILRSTLALPSEEVIQLILAFAVLRDCHKLEILLLMQDNQARRNQINLDKILDASLSTDSREWCQILKSLSETDFCQALVWLSRYCLDSVLAVSQLEQTTSLMASELFVKSQQSANPAPIKQVVLTDQQVQAQLSMAAGAGPFRSKFLFVCVVSVVGILVLTGLSDSGRHSLSCTRVSISQNKCEQADGSKVPPILLIGGLSFSFVLLLLKIRE